MPGCCKRTRQFVYWSNMRILLAAFFLLILTALPTTAADQRDIDCAVAAEKVKNGALLVDVRTKDEFDQGHLVGARNIPLDYIEGNADALAADKDREIVLYCRSGRRSGIAQTILRSRGFRQVLNAGGYETLKDCFSASPAK